MTGARRVERWERDRFDELVAEAIERLPASFREFIEHTPIVVDDAPTPAMLMGVEGAAGDPEAIEEMCGLHVGVANPDRSVSEGLTLPSQIHLFRVGIINLAGGWLDDGVEDAIYGEIMVTLLHEIGHQMGLEEDDLDGLGYA